jgi:undecaprenyl-diphosphatase
VLDYLISIDLFLFHLINGLAGTYESLDELVVLIASNDLVKGMFVWTVWWGLWFLNRHEPAQLRAKLLATAIISIVAIVVGRILSTSLPFRLRPIHNPEIPASLPINVDPLILDGWSSLPSDHAVFFFALATSLCFIHRRIGILLLLHATLFIALPRIYAGFHFPSDVMIGGFIGMMIPLICMKPCSQWIVRSRAFFLEERYPHVFYPVLFLISVQSATIFGSSRAIVSAVHGVLKRAMS